MAEDDSTDDSQKTEDPSAKKLEDARKRGEIVYSREVNHWLFLTAMTILVIALGPSIGEDLKVLFKNFIQQSYRIPTDPKGLNTAVETLFLNVGGVIILPLVLLAIAGALGCLLQVGPLLTTKPIEPSLSKISIIAGFGRLFSKKSVVELIKSVLKFTLITAVCWMVLAPYFDGADHQIGMEFSQAMFELENLFLKMMIAVLSVLFVIAAGDYVFQRFDFMQRMRMSKQELKDEYKQTEGDPIVKGKLRQIREEKARQRMMQAVPTADVVITNPTHYAVALKYDPKEMDAPTMVAKGVDLVALKIKEVASENKVPIVENPTLARALYSSMEIDQSIPRDHFKAVAEVISYVFKLKGKRV